MILQEQRCKTGLRQPVEVVGVVVGTQENQRPLITFGITWPVPPARGKGTGTPPATHLRIRIGSVGLIEAALADPQQAGLQTHLGYC